jgi:hypothetical protein
MTITVLQSGGDRKRSRIIDGNKVNGAKIPIKKEEVMGQLLYNLSKKHTCKICNKYIFESTEKHMKNHEKYHCHVCDRYLTRFSFEKHQQMHKNSHIGQMGGGDMKKYYQENKDKINKNSKKYYQENKEKKKEYTKKYYQANKVITPESMKKNNKERAKNQMKKNKYLKELKDAGLLLNLSQQGGKVDLYINKIIKHTEGGNDYKVNLYNHKLNKIQNGNGTPQYFGRKSNVMVKVPLSVTNYMKGEAKKLKDNGFKGGIETGHKRATQLATKTSIPIEDLRYTRNFFARHIITSYPSYLKWKKNNKPYNDNHWKNMRGIMAICLWGGEPAINWVNSDKVINLLNKHFNKNYKKIKIPK